MKIVHLIDYFQPRVGYQEFYLAREHQRLGHRVDVVTSDRYFPFPHYARTVGRVLGERRVGAGVFTEEGVRVHRLPIYFECGAGALVGLRGLGRALREIGPDVVSCDGVFSPTAYLAARGKRAGGYALIYDSHAADFNTSFTSTLPRRAYRAFVLGYLIAPLVKREADCIVAVGEGQRAFLCRELGLSPQSVPIIPLGADTDRFRCDPGERQRVRAGLGLGDDDVLLVHAGKLTSNKDVHVLLAAVAPLARADRRIRLLVIGGASEAYAAELENIVRGEGLGGVVNLYDFAPANALPGLLSAADIGVWPGDHSNVIEEALAVGLPVVVPEKVSELTSTRHLLANRNGLAFPRGDALALGQAIARLVADEDLRRSMGARSRALAEREFGTEVMARRFLEVYEGARARGCR